MVHSSFIVFGQVAFDWNRNLVVITQSGYNKLPTQPTMLIPHLTEA